MSEYRRAYVPGGTFFFTVTTFERRPILTEEPYRAALRSALNDVRKRLPLESIAWVLLPDHLHTIWSLPENDGNFSLRWSLIKQQVTRQCADDSRTGPASESRRRRHEGAIWQRRFWEHAIRDETDLRHHIDYIHFNPVKHSYVKRVIEWPYSTFRKYVRTGIYPTDWASGGEEGGSNYGE